MFFRRNRCRKGHDWQYYGWSVMGFGPYRHHYECSKCGGMMLGPTPKGFDPDKNPNSDEEESD